MIYLDHHAATPLAPAAREAMARALDEVGANPSSIHAAGRRARAWLEEARRRIAAAIAADAADLVLTSGGTEACNLMLRAAGDRAGTVVSTEVEHPAVREVLAALPPERVTWLAVPAGLPPGPETLARALADRGRAGSSLVAIQWVNHETGTVFPIPAYAQVCLDAGVPLVVDATQALGKVPIDVGALPGRPGGGLVALALAASKVGGPTGAGAVWVRRGVDLDPLARGGAQERGRRAGTPDLIAHVGFGAACAEVGARLAALPRVAALRDRLEAAVRDAGGRINGDTAPRVATVVDASFPGVRGDHLVAALDLEGVCASSGAACSSGLAEPSPVIAAMYPDDPGRAASALRLSLGPATTDAEIDGAIAALGRVLGRLPRT